MTLLGDMSRRAALIRGAALAGAGGTPPAPPGYRPPALPGTAAGPASGIFRGRLVLVFGPAGTITGLFVYAAGTTPGPGNGPIFWATSGTQDPYGNAIPSTAGTAAGGRFRAGQTIIGPSGEFVYSAAPALGNLTETIAPAGGTDDFSNNFYAGHVAYAASGGATANVVAQLIGGALNLGPPAAIIGTGGAAPGGVSGSTALGFVQIDSGFTASGDVQSILSFQSKNNNPAGVGASLLISGLVQLLAQAAPASTGGAPSLFADLNDILRFIAGGGDGNTYSAGQQILTSTPAQLINSTSPVQITGMSTSILAGVTYELRIAVLYTGGQAAGTAVFGFDGSSSTSAAKGWFDWTANMTAPGTFSGPGLPGATSPTLTTNQQALIFDGFITCSVSGTLNVRAQEGLAGDTFTINSAKMVLTPA